MVEEGADHFASIQAVGKVIAGILSSRNTVNIDNMLRDCSRDTA